jgi:hypothetical protein
VFDAAGKNNLISLAVNVGDYYVSGPLKGSRSLKLWFHPENLENIIKQICWHDSVEEIILFNCYYLVRDFFAPKRQGKVLMEVKTLQPASKPRGRYRTEMMEFIMNKVQKEVQRREATSSAGNTSDPTRTSAKVKEIVDRIKLGEVTINGESTHPLG